MFYHKNVLYTQNVCTIVCIMSRLVSWKRRFRQDYFHLFQNLGDSRWNEVRHFQKKPFHLRDRSRPENHHHRRKLFLEVSYLQYWILFLFKKINFTS